MSPGSRPKGRKRLEQFPKPAAPHEIIYLAFGAAKRPDTNGSHDEEVANQYDVIDGNHVRTSMQLKKETDNQPQSSWIVTASESHPKCYTIEVFDAS
ncbi:MAG: hypothetical protein QF408_05685 [Pirellulales bacterium]|nr:hypothetical protein [Pirellulales bacterium]HJN65729.1 hypothetical protein [Pirellulales bacterium]